MKFIFATIFSASALIVSAQQEYLTQAVYDKSPCTAAKLGVFVPSTVSGETTSCQSAISLIKAAYNSTSCLDFSKYTSELAGFFGTYECIKDTPEAWAKKSFSGKYLASLAYSDAKCSALTGGALIAADGSCVSLPSSASTGISYKVTASADSITFDKYQTLKCAGTADSNTLKTSDLKTDCIATGRTDIPGVKLYVSSGIRSAVSVFALGSVVILSMLLALF